MLTTHQQEKGDETLKQLSLNRFVVLEGSAGVGKTFLANFIISEFSKIRRGLIYCSAPTNKAVAVLRGKVKQLSDLEFITTHSALRMRKKVDRKTGKVSFQSYANNKYPILAGVKLLVIDEASMLNTIMLDSIEKHAALQHVKVLFIGDNKQLNPVGEDNSPVFERDYPTVTLTEIIRQGEGSPIIELSRNIPSIWQPRREPIGWNGSGDVRDNRNDVGGYIYSKDFSRIVDTLAWVNGTDDLKYLAWTNKDVDNVNNIVRNKIYGRPDRVQQGETLIFDTPYLNIAGEVVYYTNEEVKAEEVFVKTQSYYYPIKSNVVTGERKENKIVLTTYCVNPDEYAGLKDGVLVLHESSDVGFQKIVKEMTEKCYARDLEWKDYFEFIEQFAKIKYNHAITVHKSQGSTYNKVIINVKNLSFNKKTEERQRLFYTGITRASELLILYNV